MVKVLIVEDEKAAMERICHFSLWNDSEFTICDTANNGIEGLEKWKECSPDLIISDIEMPLMNGIEMIQEIRESDSIIPIIILSCYESFSYARMAVSLGVNDYLLKDFMAEDSLSLALSKAKEIKEKKHLILADKIEESKKTLSFMLSDALHYPSSLGKFKNSCEDNHLFQECSGSFFLILIHLDKPQEDSSSKTDIAFYMDQILKKKAVCLTGFKDNKEYISLIKLIRSEEKSASLMAAEIHAQLSSQGLQTTVVQGEAFDSLREVEDRFREVSDLVNYRLFLGKNRVILPSSIKVLIDIDPKMIDLKLDEIEGYIFSEDREKVFPVLKDLYHHDLPGMMQYQYLEFVNTKVISMILKFIEKKNLNIQDLFGENYLPIKKIEVCETVQDLLDEFQLMLEKVFKIENQEHPVHVSNHHVQKVINLIRSRYKEDLSLDHAAEAAGVHKVYLSRVFKKEVGKNYYEYLQYYRIERSVELLLETEKKIYEIAQLTGFNSYDQFCVVFKKYKNQSPSEFRNKG